MSALNQQVTGRQWVGRGAGSRSAPDVSPARATLRPVPVVRTRMSRVPFILVLIGLFGFGMAGLLMLNTTLQNQAFEARTLSKQATELAYTQASLERHAEDLRAPQELARRASALGLRPNPHPAFLLLPDGKIIGDPQPVLGNEVPSLIIKTPQQLAAEKAAAEAKKAAEAAKKAAAQKAAEAKKAAAEAAKKKAAEEAKKKPANTPKPAYKKPIDKKPAENKKPGRD
jgi:hypothetical protein